MGEMSLALGDCVRLVLVCSSTLGCYQALGLIHQRYRSLGGFKDYISTPKPNHYQSIHTTILGPGGELVQLILRTAPMHQVAEQGIIAHWRQQEMLSHRLSRSRQSAATHASSGVAPGGSNGASPPQEPMKSGSRYCWLQSLQHISDASEVADDFIEAAQMELLPDQIFCFTPKGDIVPLPRGSTPLDFAYAIHSSIGHRCSSCRVNGRAQSIHTTLRNGDRVEIITSTAVEPTAEWASLVKSGRARAEIRRFIGAQRRHTGAANRPNGSTIEESSDAATPPKQVSPTTSRFAFRAATVAAGITAAGASDAVRLAAGEAEAAEVAAVQAAEAADRASERLSIFQQSTSAPTPSRDNEAAPGASAAVLETWSLDPSPGRLATGTYGAIPSSNVIAPPRSQDDDGSRRLRRRAVRLRVASCCGPVPGDPITGVLHPSGDLHVHRDCCRMVQGDGNQALRGGREREGVCVTVDEGSSGSRSRPTPKEHAVGSKNESSPLRGERVAVRWGDEWRRARGLRYLSRLKLKLVDNSENGPSLTAICSRTDALGASIAAYRLSRRPNGTARAAGVTLEVDGLAQLLEVMRALRTLPDVSAVERV